VVTVHVDNKLPEVNLTIDLGVGGECADFPLGVTFTGTYKAKDEHFHSFVFEVEPIGPANGILPTPPSGASVFSGGAIADPGVISVTYSFNTTGMRPCGYALILRVWDRTNVNSGTSRNMSKASVGFCLRGSQCAQAPRWPHFGVALGGWNIRPPFLQAKHACDGRQFPSGKRCHPNTLRVSVNSSRRLLIENDVMQKK
jgi:hypothetical protein